METSKWELALALPVEDAALIEEQPSTGGTPPPTQDVAPFNLEHHKVSLVQRNSGQSFRA